MVVHTFEKKSRMSPHTKRVLKKHLFVYAMLSVAIIHFAIFYVYVNLDSFLLAFKSQETGAWSLSNFEYFFNNIAMGAQSDILMCLGNTLIYFILGLVCNLLSFLSAYFIYKKIACWRFFRFMFVIPMIVSQVVLVMIYKNLLTANGPIDMLWQSLFSSRAPSFLYDTRFNTWCIVLFVIWTSLGMNIILFSGAMNRIPESVIEYGKIDGAKPMREMFQIVLPMIAPTFGTIMLLSCVSVFGASGPILLFYGNNAYETDTIQYWMYRNVIVNQQFNIASAFGLILSICSLPIFFLMNWLVKKLPDDVAF